MDSHLTACLLPGGFGDEGDLVGDDEGAVEPDAELADELRRQKLSFFFAPSIASRKASVPLWAMVPMFSTTSS